MDERLPGIALASSYYALGTARSSHFPYAEPSDERSIEDLDSALGSTDDVADPLLSAHRFIRFYLASSGETVASSSRLFAEARTTPLIAPFVLARTTAEHASRAMFLADPGLTAQRRVVRAAHLAKQGAGDSLSASPGSADHVERWDALLVRHGQADTADDLPAYADLVGDHFDATLYAEWGGPLHGNGLWVEATARYERDGVPLRRIDASLTLATTAAWLNRVTDRVAGLWSIDLDGVRGDFHERHGYELPEWPHLQQEVATLASHLDAIVEKMKAETSGAPPRVK